MRKTAVYILALLSVLFAFISCDPETPVNPKSPTIRGTVSIPKSATGLTGDDFFVRVMEGEKAVYTGKVNADGSFAVEGLDASKTYNILITTEEPGGINDSSRAVDNGYGGWLSNVTASIDEKAGVGSIKVKPLGTIKGTVKKDGSEDHYDTMVYIPGTSFMAMTDGEGNFSMTNVPQSQNYTIRYSSSGYLSQMKSGVVLYSESDTENPVTTVEELTLIKNAGTLAGRVFKSGMNDNSNVTILVGNEKSSRTGSTNPDGSFLIDNLELGTYNVVISAEGYQTHSIDNVTIKAGVKTALEMVTLKSYTSKVSGKVLLEGTEDNAGISVMLKNSSVQYDATTDNSGEFMMSWVNPGEYTLIVSKTGYVSKTIAGIVVEASSTLSLDSINLDIGSRSVSGTVRLELRTDHSGALITATNLSDPTLVYSAITNSAGAYTLAGMKPGEYAITVSCTNYSTTTLPTINVIDGSTRTLDPVNLPIARGTISGSAVLEGRGSNAGITVELMKGTEVYATTTTDDSGLYSFRVPQGNYSGVRLSCEDFRSVSIAQSIALIANDYVTIEGGTTNMVATHVPVVRGRLTVRGLLSLDFSGIRVSIEGTDISTTTDKDGYWSFSKVPVGRYTLRFERENTNVVTKAVDVAAAAEKVVEDLELIPNAASIEGHVTLDGMTDHSNVTVRATAPGMVELSTKTNAAGYFYLGNVVTTETYTVHFEKDGWNARTTTVSGLEDLSLNDITSATPIELVDTTAPSISSYTITTGNSEAEGRKINIHFNMTEMGSGATSVYISTSNDFSSVEPVTYANPLSCYVPDVAGTHTLYIKVQDKADNMSDVKEQTYTVADYKTVVYGVLVDNEDGLNDGVITWTKARSPYYVTGNIMVEDGTTLIIEPGVNIQFAGEYSMYVEGKLLANGTESENAYFYGVGAGENNWTGIKGVFNKGSKLSHSTITNMKSGIQGYIDIEDSEIHAAPNAYALGIYDSSPYYGSIRNSIIDGKINTSYARFNTCSIMLPAGSSYRSSTNRTDFYESTVSGGYLTVSDGASYNSSFQSVTLTYENFSSVNTEFSGCDLSITGGMIYRSELNNCTFSSFSYGTIKDSNIIECGTISTLIRKSDHPKFSLTCNYWGETNTTEINRNGVNSNLSFIVDYYDDFNVTKMDLSGYKTSLIAESGRKTIEFTEPEYEIGDVGPAGGYVFYDKGYYSDGWRYLEAAPSDIMISDSHSFVFGYFREVDDGNNIRTGTGYGIGFGKLNTEMLVSDMGESAYTDSSGSSKTGNYAAKMCADYNLNGYDDWFLPSRDELNLMYKDLYKNGVGSFVNYDNYWSSSGDNNVTLFAWKQYFSNGNQGGTYRDYVGRVRAVRAF